jgi:arylsulfatase
VSRSIRILMLVALSAALSAAAEAQQSEKPNILVIWGDDIGVHNVSAYNHGIMGYRTPNIDRKLDGYNAGMTGR